MIENKAAEGFEACENSPPLSLTDLLGEDYSGTPNAAEKRFGLLLNPCLVRQVLQYEGAPVAVARIRQAGSYFW